MRTWSTIHMPNASLPAAAKEYPSPPDDRGSADASAFGRWFGRGRDRAYPSLLCVPQVLFVAPVLRTHGRVRSIDGFVRVCVVVPSFVVVVVVCPLGFLCS